MFRFFIGIAVLVCLIAGAPRHCRGWADSDLESMRYETNQPFVHGEKSASKPWSAIVGKKVEAEGIAWVVTRGGDLAF